jgi:hypothetical protein
MADFVPIPIVLFERLARAGLDVDGIPRRANLPRSRFNVAKPDMRAMPTDYRLGLQDRQRVQCFGSQAIELDKHHAIDPAEGHPFRRSTTQPLTPLPGNLPRLPPQLPKSLISLVGVAGFEPDPLVPNKARRHRDERFPDCPVLRLSKTHYISTYVMIEVAMANVVTINRPDIVALIEEAAKRLTNGNKTEAVALAMRRLLEQDARAGSLFGAHRGSVRVREGIDLIAPILDVEPDAETGREIDR